MAFELRVPGRAAERFDTEAEAMAAAKAVIAANADAEPEVVDLSTGEAAAPGADAESREALKNSLGY